MTTTRALLLILIGVDARRGSGMTRRYLPRQPLSAPNDSM